MQVQRLNMEIIKFVILVFADKKIKYFLTDNLLGKTWIKMFGSII